MRPLVRWGRRLVKLARLRPSELQDVASAQWDLVIAQCRVWRHPKGEFLQTGAVLPADPPSEAELARARRLAVAVGRVSKNGLFRPACLTRALALQRMLERRGIRASRVCVGVRKEGDRFEAHAWVELGAEILGDRAEHVHRFEGLTELQLRGRR